MDRFLDEVYWQAWGRWDRLDRIWISLKVVQFLAIVVFLISMATIAVELIRLK